MEPLRLTARVITLLIAITSAAEAQNWCAPASPTTDAMTTRLRQIATASGSSASSLRARLQLPAVSDTSTIVRMVDDSTCHALASAQGTKLGRSPEPVSAVQVGGTRFVVYDPRTPVGEYESLSIYNDQFQYLVSMAF